MSIVALIFVTIILKTIWLLMGFENFVFTAFLLISWRSIISDYKEFNNKRVTKNNKRDRRS